MKPRAKSEAQKRIQQRVTANYQKKLDAVHKNAKKALN